VANNIKRFRKKRGLTQEDMTKFGFNYRHYQRVEGGKQNLSLFTLQKIAAVFKVNEREFFE
jgi:transcriptional regulator with XRE-family HTH domain